MNFNDAVISMQKGEQLVRTSWTGYYATVLPNPPYIWTIGTPSTSPNVNASIYIPTVEDALALDWMIKKK